VRRICELDVEQLLIDVWKVFAEEVLPVLDPLHKIIGLGCLSPKLRLGWVGIV
jgi:hypothetical protein